MQHNEVTRPLSKQKRWWFAISLTLIIILILTAWTTRNRQAIAITTPYLTPFNMQITCLDWSLKWDQGWKNTSQNNQKQTGLNQPNIKIKQLCLTHPHGEITISNLIIDNIKAPKMIFIGQVDISANKSLGKLLKQFQSATNATNQSKHVQTTLLNDIEQFLNKTLIPFDFALGKLTLTTPNLIAPIQITGSQGAQNLILQIDNQQQTIALAIDYQKQSANINANIDLAPLFTMLTQQQIKLPSPFTPANIAGTIQTDITLSRDAISWQNTAKPINIGLNNTNNELLINALNSLSDNLKHKVKKLLAANPINTITLSVPSHSTASFKQGNIQISNLSVHTNNHRLNAKFSDLTYDTNTRNFAFDINAKSDLNLPQHINITKQPIKANVSTTMTGQLTSQSTDIRLSDNSQITLSLNQLKHRQIKAETLDIEVKGPIHWHDNQLNANTTSNLRFSNIKHRKLANIDSLALTSAHKLTGKLATLHHQSTTQMQLNDNPIAKIMASGQLNKPNLTIKGTDISLYDLTALNRSKVTLPELVSGKLDIAIKTQLHNLSQPLTNNITGQFALKDVSGEHDNTWFESLNYKQNFTIKEGLLSTQNTNNLAIGKIETGAILTGIKAQLNYQANLNVKDIQPTFRLNMENVSTQAFGGQFSFAQFEWPAKQAFDLTLDAIDLEQVVALEKQQGIKVTGLISGKLPTTITKPEDKWAVTIDNGEIHNITDGVIQIKNNPAVKRLKTSRDDLRLAFDALQNLHYQQLNSQVTMSDDGQMYLQTVIKGINPDLDNEVNFNLNLDYDLLGLLQSALISKNVEQQVNDKVKN